MDPAEHQRHLLSSNMLELHQMLKSAESDLINTIPEQLFVEYFLPMFSGQITDVKVRDKILTDWNQVAGTLVSEVRVVNGLGEELFRVPPMARTHIFDVTKQDETLSLDEIVAHSARLHLQSPARSKAFQEQNYQNKVKEMYIKGNKRQDDINRWAEIFLRYNVGSAQALAGVPADQQPAGKKGFAANTFSDSDEIPQE